MSIATNGLIGYWNNKQGVNGTIWENIAPSTKGNYDGIISGAVSYDQGMYFDGVDDQVMIPAMMEQNESTKYEVEVYFKMTINSNPDMILGLIGALNIDFMNGQPNGFVVAVHPNGLGVVVFNSEIEYTLPKDTTIKINMSWDLSNRRFSLYVDDVPIVLDAYEASMALSGPSKRPFSLGSVQVNNQPGNYFYGHIKSVKLYDRHLLSSERTQNSVNGEEVGLTETVVTNPVVTNIYANKITISDEEEANQSIITVQFDTDVVQYIARINGVDHNTGTIVHEGGAIPANTNAEIIVDWNELLIEGVNRINIYGKNSNGEWTTYIS